MKTKPAMVMKAAATLLVVAAAVAMLREALAGYDGWDGVRQSVAAMCSGDVHTVTQGLRSLCAG